MSIYPLVPIKKGSKILNPHASYYTDESASRLCNWYLKAHHFKNEDGKPGVNYRLHSREPKAFADYMAYDINCPKCGHRMHPVADAVDYHTLAMYSCRHCNEN